MGHRAGLLEQDFARAADGSVTLETSYPVIPKMMSPVRGRLPPPPVSSCVACSSKNRRQVAPAMR